MKSSWVYKFILALTMLATYRVGLVQKAQAPADLDYFYRNPAVKVTLPHNAPTPSQASIDMAIALFSIQIPAGHRAPQYDPALPDRGLTKRKLFTDEVEIYIGNPAFQNWSVLGSTLAHEVEVHGRQSVLAITAMNIFGINGTELAERQAYLYEIQNGPRFGLNKEDAQTIHDTMDYFYPLNLRGGLRTVQNFFARSLLNVPQSSVVAPTQNAENSLTQGTFF